MKSVIQTEKECYLCGNTAEYGMNALESHHIYAGRSNRAVSEKYGLKVWLCGHNCHRYGKHAVHQDREVDLMLKRTAQRVYEAQYGSREDFIRDFGRSWLDDTD